MFGASRVRISYLELIDKPQIATVHEADVVDTPAHDREPVEPHAKGESLIFRGVDAGAFEDVRVHHPGPHHLNPLTAQLLRHVLADDAHIYFDRRLRKREKARPKAYLDVRPFEQFSEETCECPIEVRKRHVLPYRKPLYLEEFRLVCHIGRFVAKNFAWHYDAIRRLDILLDLLFHVADLHGRCMRAQDHSRLTGNKKSVLHVTRGVVLWYV